MNAAYIKRQNTLIKKITDSLYDIIDDFDNYTPRMIKSVLEQSVNDVKNLEPEEVL